MDQADAEDLQLFIENDGQLYERTHVPIMKNLMAKRARGTYDHALAPKAFGYLVEEGAKKYAREFADNASWSKLFPPAVRREAAKGLADRFEIKAKLGELDYLVPGGGSGRTARAGSSSRTGRATGRKTAAQLDGEIAQALREKPASRSGPRVLGVSRVKTFAGRSSIRADVQYPGEDRARVEFVGPSAGAGPVVMILRGHQTFVDDPSRFGNFGPDWVRRFYAS